MPTIAEAFAQALAYHRAGQLQPAEQIYREILRLEPQHADAWHFLGVLAHQAGQREGAIDFMDRSITLSPHVPAFHSNLGEVYRALGRLDEAETCYRRAV